MDIDKKINTHFKAQIELRYLQLYPPRLESQFVNYFSQNLTVFNGYCFKLNEDGSFTLDQFILISFTLFGFPSGLLHAIKVSVGPK